LFERDYFELLIGFTPEGSRSGVIVVGAGWFQLRDKVWCEYITDVVTTGLSSSSHQTSAATSFFFS
jgi:hypothetical protein